MIDLSFLCACCAKTDDVVLFAGQMHHGKHGQPIEHVSKRLHAFLAVSDACHVQPEQAVQHQSRIRKIQTVFIQICRSLLFDPSKAWARGIIVDALI
jgi:hypothetical protein